MSGTKTLALVALILASIIAALSLFTVDETQRALVVRLGKMHRDESGQARVLDAGLQMKVPFIDSVVFFDRRIQTLDISSSRIPTAEKKQLIVDLFAKWRIKDFEKFYISTSGYKPRAERLLKEKIEDGLRAEFGRRNLDNIVSQDRQIVMDKIREDANNAAKSLGLEVVDSRIVRIDLPSEVSEQVYSLMRAERQRVATEQRARGQSKAEAIRAGAEAKAVVIEASAERDGNNLKGEGDATAAKIFANVYNQDPEFYSFYRSLEAYKETFSGKNDMLLVAPDDAFFKYFRENKKNASQEGR